jgi:hypothetical protein
MLKKLKSLNLPPDIQKKVMANPLNTTLRNESVEDEKQFEKLEKTVRKKDIPIPEEFNGPEVWKDLLSPVKNQGRCQSCYAFATTSTLADRFNIQSKGLLNVNLSPAMVILCNFQGNADVDHPENDIEDNLKNNTFSLLQAGCTGNSLLDPWQFLTHHGTAEETCVPYSEVGGGMGGEADPSGEEGGKQNSSQDSSQDSLISSLDLSSYSKDNLVPMCQNVVGMLADMCSPNHYDVYTGEEYGKPMRRYRALNIYSVPTSELDIRYEIFSWGPVSSGMEIYESFYTFDAVNDVYTQPENEKLISGHAIEIVGWGVFKDIPYWWIRNSWGPDFGVNGYFRMQRGVNCCKLEENIITCTPDFFYPYGHVVEGNGVISISTKVKEEPKFSLSAGGFDPTTGYSRRAMITKPWFDFKAPLDLDLLPDFKHFVAGNIKEEDVKRMQDIRRKLFGENEGKKDKGFGMSLWKGILCLIIVCICLYLLFLLYRKIKRKNSFK